MAFDGPNQRSVVVVPRQCNARPFPLVGPWWGEGFRLGVAGRRGRPRRLGRKGEGQRRLTLHYRMSCPKLSRHPMAEGICGEGGDSGVMSNPRAIVHIGTHRTGTTSLQGFLGAADRTLLRPQGFRYYSGIHQGAGHVELHMAAMREGRSSPARRSFRPIPKSTVTARVQAFLALAARILRSSAARDSPTFAISMKSRR